MLKTFGGQEALLLLISLLCDLSVNMAVLPLWVLSATHLSKLDSIQKMAERFSRCKFPSLHSCREVSLVGLLHKLLDKRGRGPLQHFYPPINTTPPTHSYSLQSLSRDPLLYLHWFNIHPWIYFEGASLEVQLQTFGHLLL